MLASSESVERACRAAEKVVHALEGRPQRDVMQAHADHFVHALKEAHVALRTEIEACEALRLEAARRPKRSGSEVSDAAVVSRRERVALRAGLLAVHLKALEGAMPGERS